MHLINRQRRMAVLADIQWETGGGRRPLPDAAEAEFAGHLKSTLTLFSSSPSFRDFFAAHMAIGSSPR